MTKLFPYLLFATTVGCMSANPDESNAPEVRLGTTSQAVANGQVDSGGPARDWVVRLGEACGGSLISPNWILTAAHCVAYGDNPAEGQSKGFVLQTVTFGPDSS